MPQGRYHHAQSHLDYTLEPPGQLVKLPKPRLHAGQPIRSSEGGIQASYFLKLLDGSDMQPRLSLGPNILDPKPRYFPLPSKPTAQAPPTFCLHHPHCDACQFLPWTLLLPVRFLPTSHKLNILEVFSMIPVTIWHCFHLKYPYCSWYFGGFFLGGGIFIINSTSILQN